MAISFFIALRINILLSFILRPKSGNDQIQFMNSYEFPDTINKKVKQAYPTLTKNEMDLV